MLPFRFSQNATTHWLSHTKSQILRNGNTVTSTMRIAPAAVVIVVVAGVVVVVVGQSSSLHFFSCLASPEHPCPPCAAFGALRRFCLPPPQVLEQSPSSVHGVHLQFTARRRRTGAFLERAAEMVTASNSSSDWPSSSSRAAAR